MAKVEEIDNKVKELCREHEATLSMTTKIQKQLKHLLKNYSEEKISQQDWNFSIQVSERDSLLN